MSASGSSFTWDNSSDVLQGIIGPRITATQAELLPDGMTSPGLALEDPASFLGLQFGTDPGILPHNYTSILNHCPPLHKQSSPTPHQLDYSYYHPPRFMNNPDSWNPLQVTGVPPNSLAFPMLPLGQAHHMNGFDRRCSTGQYGTPSENGSQYNGLHSSDSGYSTQSCTTRSIAASYAMDSVCSPHLAPHHDHENDNKMSALDISSTHHSEPMDLIERPESPSLLCYDTIKCDYPSCQWTGKCPSDKRKHEARHKKLFKCDEPNCSRKEGFGTINDLARHKKCVHKRDPERGPKVLYMCFGQNCPRRNKKWPRLDNFRQHLARMHNDEDVEELLRKSHEWYENCVKLREMRPPCSEDFLEDATASQLQEIVESDNLARNLDQEFCTPGFSNPPVLDPVEMLTMDSIKRLDQEHENHPEDHVPMQTIDLPTLNALNLEPTLEQRASIPSQFVNSKADKMDDMISEAAASVINAMTKMINNHQRRRGQRGDGYDLAEQEGDELSDRKREMLQRILTAALERLSGSSGPTPGTHQDSANGESDQKGWIQCEFCTKRTRLRCEMKKHKKRHERPYGCTFYKCDKTFGSKADWKRHEQSQHFGLQGWQCTLPDPTQPSILCARPFHRQEEYVRHLKKHHQADEEEVRTLVRKDRLSWNGEPQFWCGFCRDIIHLRGRGLAAWNQRFNHIDLEHFKKGERIGDWFLPAMQMTKDREGENDPIMDENSDDESVCRSNHSHRDLIHKDAMAVDQGISHNQPPSISRFDHSTAERTRTNHRKRKLAEPQTSLPSYQPLDNPAAPNVEKKSRTRSTQPHPRSTGVAAEPGKPVSCVNSP
ncbi:hypothetical protein P175DRAFT_0496941 [Aspergillus ochraceoroseus IBT 24754]|uniref:C2H2-type domain-containing protein n=1 Tax=Aspergillus ochraceoroseus IBT 24754 TaxID=1392256 RepID=A0A2T5M5L0_9EURO|nr:uncharacterized protein P175DRAFT_0496941 [Aspergillus ochraceoroseus IBT 24754]PTU23814.1 hypothetical protein P175DRAFT_0496941 [Aspergillus ochraceoroseus IBT 24754]